jgi:hypothetical protein
MKPLLEDVRRKKGQDSFLAFELNKNTLDFSPDFKTLFVEFEPSVRFNECSSPFNTAKKFYLCISF